MSEKEAGEGIRMAEEKNETLEEGPTSEKGPEFPDIELNEERGDDWDEIGASIKTEIGSLPFAITVRYPRIENLALWAKKEKNRRGW